MTMLSVAFLLLSTFPIYVVILLIVPLFVFSHTLHTERRWLRVALISLWGVVSVVLFSLDFDIYTIAALHTFFGAILISKSVLYPGFKKMVSVRV